MALVACPLRHGVCELTMPLRIVVSWRCAQRCVCCGLCLACRSQLLRGAILPACLCAGHGPPNFVAMRCVCPAVERDRKRRQGVGRCASRCFPPGDWQILASLLAPSCGRAIGLSRLSPCQAPLVGGLAAQQACLHVSAVARNCVEHPPASIVVAPPMSGSASSDRDPSRGVLCYFSGCTSNGE